MAQNEAVAIIMKTRGYKPFPNSNGGWVSMSSEKDTKYNWEALQECLDLNILAEIWKTQKWVVELHPETGCCYIWRPKYCSVSQKTIQEAALLATAEALNE